MTGWKSKVAGVGAIFTGFGMIVNCVVAGDYSNLNEAFMTIFGGFGVLGVAHKIEKLKG